MRRHIQLPRPSCRPSLTPCGTSGSNCSSLRIACAICRSSPWPQMTVSFSCLNFTSDHLISIHYVILICRFYVKILTCTVILPHFIIPHLHNSVEVVLMAIPFVITIPIMQLVFIVVGALLLCSYFVRILMACI